MKVFLIILLILLILIILVCLSGVVISFSYWGGVLEWSVKYLGIKVLPRKKKDENSPDMLPKPKKKKRKKGEKEEEHSDSELDEDSQEKPKEKRKDFLFDKFVKTEQKLVKYTDLAGNALAALEPSLPHVLKGVKWYRIETNIVVGGEDAGECAQLYGKVQAILQTVIEMAGHWIKVNRKSVMVDCDFTEDSTKWNVRFCIRIQVGALAHMGISFLWHFLKDRKATKKMIVSEKV